MDSVASLALTVMQSLSCGLQQKTQVYESLHDKKMTDDRWNPADQVSYTLLLGSLSSRLFTDINRDISVVHSRTTE